jgi:hypothetical protein
MSEPPKEPSVSKARGSGDAADREGRLALALKANLARRKAQSRMRAADPPLSQTEADERD